jgi:hypothetical protein
MNSLTLKHVAKPDFSDITVAKIVISKAITLKTVCKDNCELCQLDVAIVYPQIHNTVSLEIVLCNHRYCHHLDDVIKLT